MKKYLLVLSAILPTFAIASYPDTISTPYQKHGDPSWSITVSPLQLVIFQASGKLEMKVADSMSLYVPVDFQFYPQSLQKTGELLYTASGLGARYYFSGTALTSGLFIDGAIVGGFGLIRADGKTDSKGFFVRPVSTIGYRINFGGGFALNAGLGVAYNYSFNPDQDLLERELSFMKRNEASATRMLAVMQGLHNGFMPTGELSLSYTW